MLLDIILYNGLLTFFSVFWALLFASCFAVLSYEFCHRSHKPFLMLKLLNTITLPAIVLAPLLVLLAAKGLGIYLVFPLGEKASQFHVIPLYTLCPGFILFLASGLPAQILKHQQEEWQKWSSRTFAIFTKSLGGNTGASLRRLIVPKALLYAWITSLPWLFAEIIIIEAVFNVPGLGFTSLHLAKSRQLEALGSYLVSLVLLLGVFYSLGYYFYKRLGKRLESYA